MAYTKAPVSDTHNVIRIPTIGTPFAVSSQSNTNPPMTTLSTLDCFPKRQKQWGTDPTHDIVKREAWDYTQSNASALINGIISRSVVWCESAGTNMHCFIAVNGNIWRLEFAGSITTPNIVGVHNLSGGANSAQYVYGTLAINSAGDRRVCFLDATNRLYISDEIGGSTSITVLPFDGRGFGGLVFLDGYLFALDVTTGYIYNSDPDGALTTWNTTNFIDPEIYPDKTLFIDKHHNYLVAFGNNSIEFFYDGAVEVGSPLVRQETYASRIGFYQPNNSGDPGTQSLYTGAETCHIGDDIYFIGKSEANALSLYRIRDFKVEEINNYFVGNVLNWEAPGTFGNIYLGVQTMLINNEPMVNIATSKGYELVYYPDEDTWWMLRTNQDGSRGLTSVNTDFPGFEVRLTAGAFPKRYYHMRNALAIAVDASLQRIRVYYPNSALSVQADLFTEVVDLGINYYKHVARVDAIGDYGDNTLTLAYNPTPNYSINYVNCTPVRQPSVPGYQYNASWYNLGGMRRFSMKLTMTGTDSAIHKAFDVEYNSGAT